MQTEWTTTDDPGEWLHFFYKEGRTRTPVKINRGALESCFHSAAGESMVNIYVANVEVIHEKVRLRLRAGERFTLQTPLSLLARDFEDRRLAMYADLIEPQKIEQTAQALGDKFTADQLEAVAMWMRNRPHSHSRR
ncbi:hypothetical protein VLK31_15690 [Variovorax sp. H27-G14]|uniref:hypothetical protein n=1 Tax=Variovorax sp. H27-G14 TaxID=3111914 RepID=UPI0038FC466C